MFICYIAADCFNFPWGGNMIGVRLDVCIKFGFWATLSALGLLSAGEWVYMYNDFLQANNRELPHQGNGAESDAFTEYKPFILLRSTRLQQRLTIIWQ